MAWNQTAPADPVTRGAYIHHTVRGSEEQAPFCIKTVPPKSEMTKEDYEKDAKTFFEAITCYLPAGTVDCLMAMIRECEREVSHPNPIGRCLDPDYAEPENLNRRRNLALRA